jgi:hypothetical protein
MAKAQEESSSSQQPVRTGGRQTGPKGVLADYEYHKQLKNEASQARLRAYHKRMVENSITTTSYGQDQQELVLEHRDSDEDLLEDNEDQDAILAYRQQRLQELARMSNSSVRRQQKVFGSVEDIDADQYASVIDTEWKTVPIIIHLYDEVCCSHSHFFTFVKLRNQVTQSCSTEYTPLSGGR